MQHHLDDSENSSENIDLQESANMNDDQRELFLNIRKSASNDSFLGKLIGNTEMERRPLVLNMPDFNPIPRRSNSSQLPVIPKANYSVFKKVKNQKKYNKCDYQKNICGYITKKIIRQFIGDQYNVMLRDLCKKYHCSLQQGKKYYLGRVQHITGPSHIPGLLRPQQKDSDQIIGIKMAFREFFRWFLRQRYLRYLLLQGKMSNKLAYIQYKNLYLFSFADEGQEQIKRLVQQLIKKNENEDQNTQLLRLKSSARRKSKAKV